MLAIDGHSQPGASRLFCLALLFGRESNLTPLARIVYLVLPGGGCMVWPCLRSMANCAAQPGGVKHLLHGLTAPGRRHHAAV